MYCDTNWASWACCRLGFPSQVKLGHAALTAMTATRPVAGFLKFTMTATATDMSSDVQSQPKGPAVTTSHNWLCVTGYMCHFC